MGMPVPVPCYLLFVKRIFSEKTLSQVKTDLHEKKLQLTIHMCTVQNTYKYGNLEQE